MQFVQFWAVRGVGTMKETTSSRAGCIWSDTESRLVELKLQAFDDEWLAEWRSACFLYDGGEEWFGAIVKLTVKRCSRTLEILGNVGRRNPYWGEPKFTRKVVGKYVRRIQKDLKKAFSVYFPDEYNEAGFLLEESIKDATEAGTRALRQAEISWLEKRNRVAAEDVRPPLTKTTLGAQAPIVGTDVHQRKRGPHPNMDYHFAVAAIVKPYGADWRKESNLETIAADLDRDMESTPPRSRWASRQPPARSWARAVANYPDDVRKAIGYSLKMAARDTAK